MLRYIAAGVVGALLVIGINSTDNRTYRHEIIATTFDGQSYVAGSGDSCKSAMIGLELPDNWRDYTCIRRSK